MADGQAERRATSLPDELAGLLAAGDAEARKGAWARFIDSYSRLILHSARSSGADYDRAMDRYTYVLDQLQADDFRRLRAYDPGARGKFTTWLTIVVRRLCLDHHRERYGRTAMMNPDQATVRRRLTDLVAGQLNVEEMHAAPEVSPETRIRTQQLHESLLQAMEHLTVRDRLLLTLRFHEGLPAREIAQLMDFASPFHVYRRVNKLLEALRADLEKMGIDDASP